MNMLRHLRSTALLGLALLAGFSVSAQPASASTMQPTVASATTADVAAGKLIPVYDTDGNLIAFIYIRDAQ